MAELAKGPGGKSSAYSAHFDKIVGHRANEDEYYDVGVPMFSKFQGCNVSKPIPISPPHEAIAQEVATNPSVKDDLRRSVANREWPPCYTQHPVVQACLPTQALPLALYMDYVEFSKRDSVIGFFCENMVSGVRHLCCALRRSTMCRCGRGGWCSIHPIMQSLNWSLLALADGKWPSRNHHGDEFREERNEYRAAKAGDDLGIIGAVCWLKGDWAEHVHTLALRSWSSVQYPCFVCKCTRDDKVSDLGYDAFAFPWPLRTMDDDNEACRRCVKEVTLATPSELRIFRGKLFYDKRKDGNKGRCVATDVPALDVLKGDRVEPSARLPDVRMLDTRAAPTTIVLWRPSQVTWVTHRNPLFNERTGVDPCKTIAIDWLHCLSLGVFATFVSCVIHELLDANVWRVTETTEEAKGIASFNARCVDIDVWYKGDGAVFTRITNIKFSMFGTRASPSCSLKGAETNTFLVYLVTRVLPTTPPELTGRANMIRGGNALRGLLWLIHVHPRLFPVSAVQGWIDHTKRYHKAMLALGWPEKPKDHMLMHIGPRCLEMGAPGLYACWVDEHENRHLKSVAAAAHAAVWEKRVLSEFRAWRGKAAPKFKRPRTH